MGQMTLVSICLPCYTLPRLGLPVSQGENTCRDFFGNVVVSFLSVQALSAFLGEWHVVEQPHAPLSASFTSGPSKGTEGRSAHKRPTPINLSEAVSPG